MAFTRFNYDDSRTQKKMQESTDIGRYILNVPGPGIVVDYVSDPHIRLSKWGANLRTNTVNVNSDLRGMTRPINRDETTKNNYQNKSTYSGEMPYGTNKILTTEQSRSTNPAWIHRGVQRDNWSYLQLNPQEHTCIPFQNNLSTRILEKDHYCQKN